MPLETLKSDAASRRDRSERWASVDSTYVLRISCGRCGALASPPALARPADPTSESLLAYSIPNAARQLDLSDRTMWALVKAGEVESFTIGKSRRIARASLLAYVERRQELARREALQEG